MRASRYLGSLLGILVLLYLLVLLGNPKAPKLGLDLRGGTTVTLTAKTTDNQPPSKDALNQARQIIDRRPNALRAAPGPGAAPGSHHTALSGPGPGAAGGRGLAASGGVRVPPARAARTPQ